MLTYKCFEGLAPKHLVGKLTKRSSIHAHAPRTASAQRTFAYRGTSIWNNLNKLKKAMSFLAVFQASYKRATFRASLFIGVFFTNSYFLVFVTYN